jgi:serine/threonine protein kinase
MDPKTQPAKRPKKAAPLPTEIGGFPVVRLLGEGGMGNVYACEDKQLGRLVAIKVLKQKLAAQPAQAERFMREARAMAKIRSPHVVTVYQVGEEDGNIYLVMEVLEGEDLAERLKRKGPLSEAEAVKHLHGTIRGLRDATSAGVIHRDVKPANLFIVDGQVKLTDFGLSLPLDADAKLTQEGLVVGTPHYLAPELARGGKATEASDIYALGATLFELVVGHPPYPGKAALDVVSAHLHEPVPSPRKARRDLSRQLERLIMKMMAKKPEQRFGSYDELDKAIRDLEVENAPTVVTNQPLPTEAQATRAPKAKEADAKPSLSTSSLPGAKSMRTQTLTVMHIEIDEYASRVANASRDLAAQWLALHDALVQPCIRVYGGRRANSIGDAMLITFPSPTDAVLAGMALQDQLATHNELAAADEKVHARVTLSAGEVRLHKADIMGEPIALAAKLETMADVGDVLLNDAVFATMSAAEVTTASLGEHRFNGIRRPVHVYKVVRQAEGLPYGGLALGRVQDAQGASMTEGLKRAISSTFDRSPRTIAYRLRSAGIDVKPLLLGGAVAVALAVIIAVVIALWDSKTPQQKAEETIVQLESQDLRTLDDERELAVAYELIGNMDEAINAWGRLRKRGEPAADGLRLSYAGLNEKGAEAAIDFLVGHPDPAVEKELTLRTKDPDWWVRHNSLLALDKRGASDDQLRAEIAILDLLTGDTCSRRKWGLRLLARVGSTQAALDAVRAAKARDDNDCMTRALASAERSLAKKL